MAQTNNRHKIKNGRDKTKKKKKKKDIWKMTETDK